MQGKRNQSKFSNKTEYLKLHVEKTHVMQAN